jgi:hypothetical protein
MMSPLPCARPPPGRICRHAQGASIPQLPRDAVAGSAAAAAPRFGASAVASVIFDAKARGLNDRAVETERRTVPMNKTIQSLAALALALGMNGLAQANHVTLSGIFEGDEPTLPPFPESCSEGLGDPLGYLRAGPVQVSANGIYDVVDAGNASFNDPTFRAVDVVVRIYEGSFDPANVEANLVVAVDTGEQVELDPGINYQLVLQHWCENTKGVWAVALSGQGEITGTGVVNSPDRTIGEFTDEDPTADFGFGPAPYDVTGPIRFDEEGTYFYADLSLHSRADMELSVYEGAFDPGDTNDNLVVRLDDSGAIPIKADTDYFLVSSPFLAGDRGEWHYAWFPPGRVEINRFLSGLWFDEREVPGEADFGQGIFLEVFPSLNFVFAAWFTWDLADGAPSVDALRGRTADALGATDQRWLTAFGGYAEGDTRMDITFENSTGGIFNAPSPDFERDENYGTGSIIANGCRELVVEFDLPDAPTQGSTTLNRVEDELVQLFCSETGAQPGVIE